MAKIRTLVQNRAIGNGTDTSGQNTYGIGTTDELKSHPFSVHFSD